MFWQIVYIVHADPLYIFLTCLGTQSRSQNFELRGLLGG